MNIRNDLANTISKHNLATGIYKAGQQACASNSYKELKQKLITYSKQLDEAIAQLKKINIKP